MQPPRISSVVVVAVLSALACGREAIPNPSVEQSIAKALIVEDEKAQKPMLSAAKQGVPLGSRSERASVQQAAREAELDAAAILPAEFPTELAAACEAVVNAYDGFMKRSDERTALRWFDGRRKKLAERRAVCAKQDNVRVAACQAKALAADLATLAELDRTEAASLVLQRCADKFGKP